MGMRSLDLDSLRTFLACVDATSFAEAGEWVHKSQSTVSMQMRGLADTVGRPLFAKEGRKNVLTPAGRDLREYAQRLVRLNDEALGRFRPEGLEGRLAIGTPDDYAADFLPQVFGTFAHQHPRVEIQVVSDSSDALAASVKAGTLDLAVVSVTPSMRGVEVLHTEPLAWVAPQDRRLEETRPLPVALWQAGCVWRDMALDALDRAGVDCRPAYTGSSATSLLMTVQAGLAVSALPCRFCAHGVRTVQDGVLPELGGFDIGLLRSDSRPRPLADTFAEGVVEAFARVARSELTAVA